MTKIFFRVIACSAVICATGLLASCTTTRLKSVSKDTQFNARDMRRVMVIAVVRKPSTRRFLEDEFVRQLKKRQSDGVASYTLVPEDAKLDEAAWKRVVSENQCDAVIVSRLVDLAVVEKEVDPKYIHSNSMGSYGYYNMSYHHVYQPSYTYRKETAAVETRVFQSGGDKQMWTALSKTNIEEGRDPEAQVRDFVQLMMGKIYD